MANIITLGIKRNLFLLFCSRLFVTLQAECEMRSMNMYKNDTRHFTLMKMNISRLALAMRGFVMVSALLFSGVCLAQQDRDHNFNVAKNIDIFNAIYRNLDMMYVDTLNADEVVGTGINAMLRSLDPYTVYYPASEVKDLKMMITGKYAGIYYFKHRRLDDGGQGCVVCQQSSARRCWHHLCPEDSERYK